MPNTKYGRQPFWDLLVDSGKTYRELAAELGVPDRHLRHALYGYVRPKYELRDALMIMFGVGLDELFTEEALAGKPHYGPRARALMTETPEEAELRRERERAEKLERLARLSGAS